MSAPRQEIVDVLSGLDAVSVRELAAALGRPADTLYFHLRALTRAGLVRAAGFRYRGGRREALFRTLAPELRLQYDPEQQLNRDAVTAIVGSMLRLGTRDFRRAFRPGTAVVSGPTREIWALRRAGRLTAAQLAAVNRSIERLAQALSTSRGAGRLYAVTVVLTPLERDRAGRRKQKTTKKTKGSKR